ncbi:MAG TPA: S8 family peptidase [Kofleriaceae bacterium]|jgi:hypothetical protein
MSKDTVIRRPLLANGERLKAKATRPRSSRDNKFHPVTTAEAHALLAPQVNTMMRSLETLSPEVVGRHVVIEATLYPNYLAPSHFPAEVLKAAGVYVVGARAAYATKRTAKRVLEDQTTRTLLLAGAPAAVKRLAKQVSDAPSWHNEKQWEELRRFSAVGLPPIESVIVGRPVEPQRPSITFEAVLSHIFDDPEHEAVWADENFARFALMVRSRGGVVDAEYRRDVGGLTFVPVLAPAGAMNRIAEFNLLRALRPMPEFAPFPEDSLRVVHSHPKLSRACRAGERPLHTIAVFDGGVNDKLPVFAPFVKTYPLTTQPAGGIALKHGSMVTSALLYGSVDPASTLPDPTVNIDHYRVFPMPPLQKGAPDHRLYDVLDKIKATLQQHHYPIVVLSIGPNDSIDEHSEPDRFTAELDALAFEQDITFIVAVGNNGELDTELGYDRVQPPGDMVNGIGVGAITRNPRDPKKRWHRANYSARGPGREGQRVQPLVVEFGGSDDELFVGFDDRGRLTTAAGTSFASPTVGRAVGGLQSLIEAARHRADIFRVFTVHHAERGRGHGKQYCNLGYGRVPASFAPAFECASNEVTVLYEDELPRGESTALRFPFPRGLPVDAKFELFWTLSYVADVDPRDATDYTLTGIETIFRPDSRKHTLTDPNTKKTTPVDTVADRTQIAAALAAGSRLSEEPSAHSNWSLTKGEQLLRRDGKWETVMPGRVLLKAGELFEPRLDLLHLRRENGRLVKGKAIQPLRFAMMLTIRCLSNHAVYDMVASQYRVLTPLVRLPVRMTTVA